MPREQAEWCVEQSLRDGDEHLHRRQHCTYYSSVNVDKSRYPYASSFEHEQTWTLTRTVSHHRKRYQSSIENIHLTMPRARPTCKSLASSTDRAGLDGKMIPIERAVSPLLALPPAPRFALPPQRSKAAAKLYEKPSANGEKTQPTLNSMRMMHINGEFIVRI